MIILESNNTQNIFRKTKLNTQHEKVAAMCKEDTTQDDKNSSTNNQQTDNEPDLDVTAPGLQYATEGFEAAPDDESQILNEVTTNGEK